jgi:recombinational DNA repair protein RecR
LSVRGILKKKSVRQLKKELSALESELATCNGCASLKCEARKNCSDKELKGKQQ